jgi:hypothetical protein
MPTQFLPHEATGGFTRSHAPSFPRWGEGVNIALLSSPTYRADLELQLRVLVGT